VRDVARILAVSTATDYALVDRGELPHVRVLNAIRVAPADLQHFINSNRRSS
jgi:excisionase family DNA binding protein